MSLTDLGYNSDFARNFNRLADDTLSPCRISLEQRGLYAVLTDQGEMPAVPTGKMLYTSDNRAAMPVVGDWVAARILDEQPPRAIIHHVLPRRSMFSRKEAGKRISQQPIAANIDTVFIVMSLDNDFSPARVERYLALVWESGASPIVLLTKCDLCPDLDASMESIRAAAPGVPIHAISVVEDQGTRALTDYLAPGRTVTLLGSSGVGKSTVVNYLLGSDLQRVREVREIDSKGRHTTTHRQLFVLPGGGLVIDTPGMRELQLWNADDGLAETFADIEALAAKCRFGDCSHNDEPGCMVQVALHEGSLERRRFENYNKMQAELRFLERKQETGLARIERDKWKSIHKQIRNLDKK